MYDVWEKMVDIWEEIKDFFKRDWTPAEKVLVILCCILLGVVKGVLWAPAKKKISYGDNCNNTYKELDEEFWLDDED